MKKIIVIILLLMSVSIFGETINRKYTLGGGLDSVIVVSATLNVTDYVVTDSSNYTSFPTEITVVLYDTSAASIKFGYYFEGALNGSWFTDYEDFQDFSPIGSGSDTLVLRFIDTANSSPVIGAGFAVLNSSNAVVASGTSQDSGKFVVNLNTGVYTVRSLATGFMSDTYNLTVSGDADTDTISMYAIVTDTPTVANTSIGRGYLKRSDYTSIEGATITAIRDKGTSAIIDTASTPSILPRIPVIVESDTLGYYQITLRGTSSFPDTTLGFYNIMATWNGTILFDLQHVWVPSSGVWEIADTLNGR